MNAARSSSWHAVNADTGLSPIGRIKWIVYNAVNNRFPRTGVDPALAVERFDLSHADVHWDAIDPQSSPSRRLTDLFWLDLPWGRLTALLGGEVRALEVGCGTGRYGILLRRCLGDRLKEYVGLDQAVHAEWATLADSGPFRFVVGDAAAIDQHLKDANLILTQSALEHFEEDLTFFRQVADFVNAAARPIVQVHLLPSADSLTIFPWHGVRQYTPRTISKITMLHGPETSRTLYALGAAHCVRFQRRAITWPRLRGKQDLRQTDPVSYERQLREAIRADTRQPRPHAASFYALVMETSRRAAPAGPR